MKVVIGSRGSKLALVQSEEVKKALEAYDPTMKVEIKVITTKGDRILDQPLNKIGDKGLFTKEIEEELLFGKIDLAVHSMKDMPSLLPEGLKFTGSLKPADPRDCMIFNHGYKSLNELPEGAIVGTGSPRRRYQLSLLRPDLKLVDIRGNVLTRLKKMQDENMDAIVLACAGMKRLGLEDRIGQYFESNEMIPACAQGILAIEVKAGSPMEEIMNQLADQEGTARLKLERLFLETIGGSCNAPIACHIKLQQTGIHLDAMYGTINSSYVIKVAKDLDQDIEENIVRIAKEMKEQVLQHG